MRQVRLHRRSWLAGSVGAITIVGTALTLAAFSAGASASTATPHGHSVSHVRPHAPSLRNGAASASTSHPVTAVTQEFGTNTTPFCPANSGNAPCDGNGGAGDYGTIDRVASGFSNGGSGNYAPSTKALTGGWMALVSGTTDENQGVGCPGTAGLCARRTGSIRSIRLAIPPACPFREVKAGFSGEYGRRPWVK